SDGRPDVLVVVSDQEPARPLKALDQVGRQRVEDVWRVGHGGLAPARWRNEAREQHDPRGLDSVAKFVEHAPVLVGRALRRGVHALRIAAPGREGLPLSHQTAKLPEDRFGFGRVAETKTAYYEPPVFGDEGAERAAVLGRPACRVASNLGPQHWRLA